VYLAKILDLSAKAVLFV